MAYDEIKDVGRAIDRPKGFVKWSLIAYWTAILGLSSFIVRLIYLKDKQSSECNLKVEKVLMTSQQTIDAIRVEYYKKLEERTNRLEHIEERVENLPKP